jgi:glutamate dehydrogenase (NADP+)
MDLQKIMNDLEKKHPGEPEYLQAVREVLESIEDVVKENPHFESAGIIDRIVEPDRILTFKVPWVDDQGKVHVNLGYRIQFNNAIGPYKGGLRFHPSVNLSILKFLGFEQIFKNALTTLPMGGGKGGSDFNPKGKSDHEIMRFCQAFMLQLWRLIGPETDVPAGDIGVGGREIGYLFGQYKRLKNEFTGVLTGKGRNWGGSLIRPEATGYGVVYFTEEMLKTKGTDFSGKRVAVSGFGNVAWGVVQKVNDLGGKVVTLSGPDGYIYDTDGVSGNKIDFMLSLRLSNKDAIKDYADKFKVEFHAEKKPWEVPVDIAIPAATQNELYPEDAKMLIQNGCQCVCEAANMPTTLEATHILQEAGVLFAPGKAANAGGVAVSGLEMAQNSMRYNWTSEEVDLRLKMIMKEIHTTCVNTAEKYGAAGNYVLGANIGGFIKVADSMLDQGIV